MTFLVTPNERASLNCLGLILGAHGYESDTREHRLNTSLLVLAVDNSTSSSILLLIHTCHWHQGRSNQSVTLLGTQ